MSPESFDVRKDKWTFIKLAKKYKEEDYLDFVVANIVHKPKIWGGELLTEDCDSRFRQHQKKMQALAYTFSEDINRLLDFVAYRNLSLDDLLVVPENGVPLLLGLYYQKEITIETLVILEKLLKFFKIWDKKITDTIIWPETRKLCLKYSPFVNIDQQKYMSILKERISGS